MDIKEILDPKKLLITIGTLVIVISILGIANSEDWAEWGWDDEPVGDHDAAYEQMWALHLLPLGVMAIGTGLFVTGKSLAQMSMISSAAVIVIIGGGMGYMSGEHGYDGTPPAIWLIIPIFTLLLTLILGITGYMLYKDLEESKEA